MVPPNPRYGQFVRERLGEFGRLHRVPESDLRDVLTAVGEALANAFEHARATEKIEAACWLVGDDRFIATIVDAGVGMSAASDPARSPTPEPTAERGRGLAIMRSCADHVAIRSVPGKGTAVVLTRFLRRRAPAEMLRTRTG